MVRIKICGITRVQDAVFAAEAGADAIGLIFAPSPRRVEISQAREITRALPPFVSTVGVFVNAMAKTIIETAEDVGLGEIQLHGDETPRFISKLKGLRVIKALRVRDRAFVELMQAFRDCGVGGILLDAFSEEARGGSGKRFDWDLVGGARKAGAFDDAPPIILAGGLTPQNVRTGVRRIKPWGVDVSSGVEDEPGVKSADKITQFIAAVRTG